MNRGVLYEAVMLPKAETFAFDVWHWNALRTVATGGPFSSARRYGSPALSSYVSVFETGELPEQLPEDVPVLPEGSGGIRQRLMAREMTVRTNSGDRERHLDAPLLYVVSFRVPEARQAEFDEWYEEEHLGILLNCPAWVMCRRLRVASSADSSPTHLALHYLADLTALQSPERDQARATPWRARLAKEDWYRGSYQLFYRLEPALALDAV